jgi:hypothetical protein
MRRALTIALLPVAALCAAAAACGDDSSAPAGSGDSVVVDVDATTQPPQSRGDGGAYYPDVFAPGDGPYSPPPDGYAPYQACAKCACGASTFCFGGGTGYTGESAVCGADAALPADGGLQLGCDSIPAECAKAGPTEICSCLLKTLSPLLPCYSVCTDTPQLIVYCPNP